MKIDLNKIKLGHSPLTDSIFLYREGKKEGLALDKREAECDVMAVLIEHMMWNAPKGSVKVVQFGDKKFRIKVEPVIEDENATT